MLNRRKITPFIVLLTILFSIQACGTALQSTAMTSSIIYTKGARQHTAMLQISLPPSDVYNGLLKVIAKRPDLKTLNTNTQRYLSEVEKDGQFLSAQATSLSNDQTLLFIWADAGNTGRTGQELAQTATEAICKELGVQCKVKEN